jgi:hypothetical protein
VAIEVRFNAAALKSIGIQAGEADLRERANRVLNAARRNAPVDEGRLRASIAVTFTKGPAGEPVARIGSNLPYALFVHEGTGIYGPNARPIRPVNGRFMRWPIKNNSGSGNRRYSGGATAGYAYAREVRGVPPRPFLRDALDAAR